jgi:aryl-alcohol dehydrogenase-like predicted oxidoreductase
MHYNFFSGTRLRVSALSLGTMMFGGQTDEAESLSIMNYAYENGINVFDTANMYTQGESERIVGKGLKGRREKIILATKVFNRTGEDPNDSGLSRRHILAAVEASLGRLQTDYIDIYYLHAPDYQTSLEETFDTMSGLVRDGKVRYLGVSNFAAWQIADILALCDKRGYVAPVITQNVYNAITRGIEAELIPFLKAHGVNLTVYNPIAGGLLAGKHKPGEPAAGTRFSLNRMYADRYWSDENFAAIENLTAIAKQCGLSLLQLAMKWCAAQKAVTSIITGVSRLSQLEQNVKSIEGDGLTDEVLERCNEVWKTLAGTRFGYIR